MKSEELSMETYSNFPAAHFQPLHDILKRMLGAVRSDRHRFVIVGTEEVVVAVSGGDIAPVLAEVENCSKIKNFCENRTPATIIQPTNLAY